MPNVYEYEMTRITTTEIRIDIQYQILESKPDTTDMRFDFHGSKQDVFVWKSGATQSFYSQLRIVLDLDNIGIITFQSD